MKPRSIIIFIIVAGIAGAAAWWLFQTPPAPPAPEKVADAPKAEAPKPPQSTPPPAPTPRVEAPAIKPVQQPAPAPTPVAIPVAKDPQSDPQSNLDSAIADICTRAQSGDLAGLMDDYISPDDQAQMPPGQFDQMKQQMQMLSSSPQGQQFLQQLTQAFEGLQGQTPTYNDAGDKATYMAPPPGGGNPQPITFKKVDGRWYADMGAGGGF